MVIKLYFQNFSFAKIIILLVAVAMVVGVSGYYIGYNKKMETTALELSVQRKLYDDENYKTMMKDFEEKKQIVDTAAELESQLSEKTKEIASLDLSIEEKTKKLSLLTNSIAAVSEIPISLLFGEFFVGVDVPAGRYKISGTSNFQVSSLNEIGKINTILGDGSIGRGDYIGTLDNGDVIKNSAPATLTLIKKATQDKTPKPLSNKVVVFSCPKSRKETPYGRRNTRNNHKYRWQYNRLK